MIPHWILSQCLSVLWVWIILCACIYIYVWELLFWLLFFSDCKGNFQCLAFVQYGFDRKEHTIDIKPHGNSKKQHSFKRTKPSTLKLVKKTLEENKRPLQVLREVKNIQGGVMSAKSGCDLPQNRRQICNAKQANKVRSETISGSVPHQDILLLKLCKCVKIYHLALMLSFDQWKLHLNQCVC